MLLFLSDLHLGRGSRAESRDAELDAVALLESSAAALTDVDGGLVLLGDVFNAYIEYRTLVPSGFVRLQGTVARLVDAGVHVTYVVGNRDPWHLTYFSDEIGVRVVNDGFECTAYGRQLFIAHGDGLVPAERTYNRIRPLLRHPLAYRLYRNVLPGDWSFRLARWVAHRGHGGAEPPIVEGIRAAAHRRLTETDADLVVLGHSHRAELTNFAEGVFLNPGYWFAERTFGVLDASGSRLLRWAGGTASTLETLAEASAQAPPKPHPDSATTARTDSFAV
jgi:UDP-2,3-diacylglucosamine hydrolase